MPRHGRTPNRDRRKHQGHRVHKRSRLARIRPHRRTPVWDRAGWLDRMAEQATTPEAVAAVADLRQLPPLRPVEMGRKNMPRPTEKPQKPKRPKGGSK